MDRLQRNPAIYKSIYKEIFVKSTKIQDNGYVQLLLKDQNYDWSGTVIHCQLFNDKTFLKLVNSVKPAKAFGEFVNNNG